MNNNLVWIVEFVFLVVRYEKCNILGSPKIVHGEGYERYASNSVPHEVSDNKPSFDINT